MPMLKCDASSRACAVSQSFYTDKSDLALCPSGQLILNLLEHIPPLVVPRNSKQE